jgi:hypothetical protein
MSWLRPDPTPVAGDVEQAHEVTAVTSRQPFSRGWHAVLGIVITGLLSGT